MQQRTGTVKKVLREGDGRTGLQRDMGTTNKIFVQASLRCGAKDPLHTTLLTGQQQQQQ